MVSKPTKKEVLKQYDEYDIPYEIAKELDEFKITWEKNFDNFKMSIEKYYKDKNKGCVPLDVICVMEFGCLDIELTTYDIYDGILDVGFMVCAKIDIDDAINYGWESIDFADLDFNLNLIKDKENVERNMYIALMDFARKKDLWWSKLNIDKNY